MALHRDIHWIGRQWAVTGFGMQAIDQRHGGQFDIEIAQLWGEGLAERLSGQKWFNADDFDKGLAAARKRYPAPLRPVLQAGLEPAIEPEPEPEPVSASPPAVASEPATKSCEQTELIATPEPSWVPELPVVESAEPPPAASSFMQLPIPGRARFVRPWRVPIKSVQSYKL